MLTQCIVLTPRNVVTCVRGVQGHAGQSPLIWGRIVWEAIGTLVLGHCPALIWCLPLHLGSDIPQGWAILD